MEWEGAFKMNVALDIFKEIMESALPFAIVFLMGEIVVRSFLTMSFRGSFEF